MQKNRYTTIIPLIFIALCAHFLISMKIDIYPSLVFPSFNGSPNVRDKAEVPTVDLYGKRLDGKLEKIDETKFFSNLFYKHTNYFLETVLKKEKIYKRRDNLKVARTQFIKYANLQLTKMYPTTNFQELVIAKGNHIINTNTGRKLATVTKESVSIKLYE